METNCEFELLLAEGLEGKWENVEIEEVKEAKSKESYIEEIKIGAMVAFRIGGLKMLSGKIIGITDMSNNYLVETKNGINFSVRRKNIVWVKTGERWPRGIFLALKGEAEDGKYKSNSEEQLHATGRD